VMSRELGLLLRDLLLEQEIGMSRLLFHEYHGVAKVLERIGDHAVRISRAVAGLNEPIETDKASRIKRLKTNAVKVVSQSVDAFLKPDLAGANRVLSEREHTHKWEEEAQLPNAGENALSLAVIFGSLLRVRDYAFNVAETALNMGVPHLQQQDKK